MTEPSEIRERIEEVISWATTSFSGHKQATEVAVAVRALPGVEVLNHLRVRDHEYEIQVSLMNHLEDEIDALELVRDLSLAAAPEVVALLPINTALQEWVLITRYSACPGELLQPVDHAKGPFSPAARDRFRADMKALADFGLVYPHVKSGASGFSQWLVSSETGTLLLYNWSCIEEGDEEETAEMLEHVDRILASRS